MVLSFTYIQTTLYNYTVCDRSAKYGVLFTCGGEIKRYSTYYNYSHKHSQEDTETQCNGNESPRFMNPQCVSPGSEQRFDLSAFRFLQIKRKME